MHQIMMCSSYYESRDVLLWSKLKLFFGT